MIHIFSPPAPIRQRTPLPRAPPLTSRPQVWWLCFIVVPSRHRDGTGPHTHMAAPVVHSPRIDTHQRVAAWVDRRLPAARARTFSSRNTLARSWTCQPRRCGEPTYLLEPRYVCARRRPPMALWLSAVPVWLSPRCGSVEAHPALRAPRRRAGCLGLRQKYPAPCLPASVAFDRRAM